MRFRAAAVVLGIAFGAAIAVLSLVPSVASPVSGPPQPPPSFDPVPPPPIFLPTGGPFIGDAKAMQIAAGLRTPATPLGRQDVRLMRYGEIASFAGSTTLTIDPAREFYFVVTSAPWVGTHGRRGPVACGSYMTVVDATEGTVRGQICGGPDTWPANLPNAFSASR